MGKGACIRSSPLIRRSVDWSEYDTTALSQPLTEAKEITGGKSFGGFGDVRKTGYDGESRQVK